jgi:hypothetical protein
VSTHCANRGNPTALADVEAALGYDGCNSELTIANKWGLRMARKTVVMLAAALLAVAAQAQGADPDLDLDRMRVVPPVCLVRGEPNPVFAAELQARVRDLHAQERPAFFKRLRREQRELGRRIEEMTFQFEKAKALKRDLQGDGATVSARAAELVAAQRQAILLFKEIDREIDQVRRREDPQRIDALDFQVDFYAGLQFSNLYSEGDAKGSFFSASKPFVSLDMRNTFRWPAGEQWMDVFGTLAFQSASKENSDTVNVITSSGNFKGEAGVWWMRSLTENVSWGLVGSLGLVGYAQQAPAQDLSASNRDEFRTTLTLGFTLRQEAGPMRTSFAEVAYTKDPLFLHPDRLLVRGQVVLTQFGSKGSNGDFYIEGKASKGRVGRDEAALLIGLRLSTISFFRGLGGGR